MWHSPTSWRVPPREQKRIPGPHPWFQPDPGKSTLQQFMSNTGMDTLQETIDQRLTRLEIKASYAEDLLDTLNQTVYRQQEQIGQLLEAVRLLRQQAADTTVQRALRDDLPPHY